VAVLTVKGTADVSLGGVDLHDSDVTGLNVINDGGLLSLTLDADKIDQAPGNNDALSFTGTGHVALTTVGAIDLHDDVLTAVSSIHVVETGTLTLSLAQYNALTPAAISVVDSTDVDTTIGSATLNIVGYDGSAFDATALDSHFDTVNLTLVDANVTLAAGVNLTNVDQITVQEGRTLTLTAAQFQQLQGNGSIVAVDTNGDGTTTPINVNITDLTQADPGMPTWRHGGQPGQPVRSERCGRGRRLCQHQPGPGRCDPGLLRTVTVGLADGTTEHVKWWKPTPPPI